MESTNATPSSGGSSGINVNTASLLISGDQQLVLSAEDAAQLLAQAGLQLGVNEQVIIGDIGAATATTANSGEQQQQEGIAANATEQEAVLGEGGQAS